MKRIFFFFLLLGISFSKTTAQNTYPTPPDTWQRLFYIQRTASPNTVVYDANVGSNGMFDEANPVNVYWLRYSEKGQKQGLNYIQRTLAYGVKTSASGSMNEYIFHLVSYSQRKFHLKKDANGRPVASLMINGKEAYLKRIFVELDPGFLGISPNIHYVEFFGVDAVTGGGAYEKFVP